MTDPLAMYQAMDGKIRRNALLAEYRCRVKGCLLLHVWQTSQGRFWYLPGYDLSPDVADAETAESARQKRTSDGYRRWGGKAGPLDRLLDGLANETVVDGVSRVTSYDDGGLTVNCDHNIRQTITAGELAASIENASPGTPTRVFLSPDTPKTDN